MTLFYTADTHFGSQRTLELSKRPFYSVEEMDDVLIDNWNEVVSDGDIVHHLGDFGNPDVLEELNGRICLLPGNYDDDLPLQQLVKDGLIKVLMNPNHESALKGFPLDNGFVKLIHEPEEADSTNDFYLFGHIHKLQMVKRNGLNVGVDCHNFRPISEEEVMFWVNAILKHYDDNVFMGFCGWKGITDDDA